MAKGCRCFDSVWHKGTELVHAFEIIANHAVVAGNSDTTVRKKLAVINERPDKVDTPNGLSMMAFLLLV